MREFPKTFRTKRSTVRDITLDDADGWKRFNNRISKRMPEWPGVPSIVYARNEILHHLDNGRKNNAYVYSVRDLSGKIIGDIHITNIERGRRRAEIGHALDPSWWGTGLSHELLFALCKLASARGYSLWGKVEDGNVRSWRSLENFGAKYIGKKSFEINGEKNILRVYELPEHPISDFARRVYDALLKVPRGRVTTYKELAKAVGTKSYRSVGQVLRVNPFAPRVPCHRVVSNDGGIGGFMGETGGLAIRRKIRLLRMEGLKIKNDRIEDFDEKKFTF